MKAHIEPNPVYIYRFLDASVPPQYHRSYTINVSPKKVAYSIDVYGKILSEKVYPITERIYKSFVTALLTLDLKEKKHLVADNPPPIGGQIAYLTIFDSLGNEIKGKIYEHNAEYDTLEGNVAAAVILFRKLVPSLASKWIVMQKLNAFLRYCGF